MLLRLPTLETVSTSRPNQPTNVYSRREHHARFAIAWIIPFAALLLYYASINTPSDEPPMPDIEMGYFMALVLTVGFVIPALQVMMAKWLRLRQAGVRIAWLLEFLAAVLLGMLPTGDADSKFLAWLLICLALSPTAVELDRLLIQARPA